MANLPDPAITFPLAVAVYSLAAYRPRSITVPVAISIVVVCVLSIALDEQADVADLAVNSLVALGGWVVGDSTRVQRERTAWLAQRQEDEARRAAAEERVRIARDLHDVVAHHISVIVVQAEAAQEVLATHPDRAEGAMAAVADTARSALGELRRMLGLLRSESGRAPQPDLAAVEDLIASVRGAGLVVELRTTGTVRPVDAVVGLTAYRIVQEALTNVMRHARGPAGVGRPDVRGRGAGGAGGRRRAGRRREGQPEGRREGGRPTGRAGPRRDARTRGPARRPPRRRPCAGRGLRGRRPPAVALMTVCS